MEEEKRSYKKKTRYYFYENKIGEAKTKREAEKKYQQLVEEGKTVSVFRGVECVPSEQTRVIFNG